MDLNQKTIIQNTLIQNLDLNENDLKIIKQALVEFWYENKNNYNEAIVINSKDFNSSIESVERKINKLLEAF